MSYVNGPFSPLTRGGCARWGMVPPRWHAVWGAIVTTRRERGCWVYEGGNKSILHSICLHLVCAPAQGLAAHWALETERDRTLALSWRDSGYSGAVDRTLKCPVINTEEGVRGGRRSPEKEVAGICRSLYVYKALLPALSLLLLSAMRRTGGWVVLSLFWTLDIKL